MPVKNLLMMITHDKAALPIQNLRRILRRILRGTLKRRTLMIIIQMIYGAKMEINNKRVLKVYV